MGRGLLPVSTPSTPRPKMTSYLGRKAQLTQDIQTRQGTVQRGTWVKIIARKGDYHSVQDLVGHIYHGIHIKRLSFARIPKHLRCEWCSSAEGVSFLDEDEDPICGRCAVKGTVTVVRPYGDVVILDILTNWVDYHCRCGKKGRIYREGLTSLFHCRHVKHEQ